MIEDKIRLGWRRLDEQERNQGKESHHGGRSDDATSASSRLDGSASSRLLGLGRSGDVDGGEGGLGMDRGDGSVGGLGGRTSRAMMSLGGGGRAMRSLGGSTNRAMNLRGGRNLRGNTNGGVRLNLGGRRLNLRGGRLDLRGRRLSRSGSGLNLRGRGGRSSRGNLSGRHVGGSDRDDGAQLGGLDGLERGGADGGLRHGGAVDEVSMVCIS